MGEVAITAAGMVTPVGFNAASTCAALRAGIRNICEANLWDPESGAYLAAGKVPLPQWSVGLGKLADLAAPAILECLTAATPIPRGEIPVLLGVAPAGRPFRIDRLESEILGEIEQRLGFELHPESRVVPRDHVAAIVGVQTAADIIDRGLAPCAVVAAVDSLLQHDLKDYYLSRRRLLTPRNSNGFSLGEAGAAVLVRASGGTRSELRVVATGLAREENTIESEHPLHGDGLVAAIRAAFRSGSVTYDDLQYRITDLNGEHFKFKEMVLAMIRLAGKPKPKLFELWHPIEYVGDVGAAIGPLVLGLALQAGQRGYGPGDTSLCTFGNDDGERGAAVVRFSSGVH